MQQCEWQKSTWLASVTYDIFYEQAWWVDHFEVDCEYLLKRPIVNQKEFAVRLHLIIYSTFLTLIELFAYDFVHNEDVICFIANVSMCARGS